MWFLLKRYSVKLSSQFSNLKLLAGVAFKLPKADVASMISKGDAQQLKMGEQIMKEWVKLSHPTHSVTMNLAKKAKTFVAGIAPKDNSYSKSLTIKSPIGKVFAAVATVSGLKGWRPPLVTGSAAQGRKIRFGFRGMDEFIIMRVTASEAPTYVEWRCETHSSLEEWKNSRPIFKFSRQANGASKLDFRHVGLGPNLECFDDCRLGWDHFLASIKSLCETGQGNPF